MNVTPRFLIRACLPFVMAGALGNPSVSAAPSAAYPQPEPSNQEQYLLELINKARLNPAAEGQMLAGVTDSEIQRYYQYYKVSTSQLVGQFNGYAVRPPLALNSNLMATARQQSLYQASSGIQTHNGANGSTFDGRISAAGYHWSAVGENVYAYAENPFFAHVGLMADWGVPSLDHRANLLNTESSYPVYREIGISAVPSSKSNFGPLVITEDFATPADSGAAYLVGVVYQDANGNGQYDEGEGLGGVTVSPDGTNYYAVTSSAGGYVIPLPTSGAGTLTITASGGALGGPRVKAMAFTAGTNAKVDFTPADAVTAAPVLPVVTLQAHSAARLSGKKGKITISRSGNLNQPLPVSLTYGGTAINGVDYATLPTEVTVAAGQASITLKVRAILPSAVGVKKVKAHVVPTSDYTTSSEKFKTEAQVKIITDL